MRKAPARKRAEKRVKVMLTRSDQNPHDTDVPVIIDGEVTIVKRGVEVEVTERVAEVLRHSFEQANAANAVQAQFLYVE